MGSRKTVFDGSETGLSVLRSIRLYHLGREEIAARYTDGILEVRLPVCAEVAVTGREIKG